MMAGFSGFAVREVSGRRERWMTAASVGGRRCMVDDFEGAHWFGTRQEAERELWLMWRGRSGGAGVVREVVEWGEF